MKWRSAGCCSVGDEAQLRDLKRLPFASADLAAIPDFQSGAMENWGLTTYRESALLFDPKKSSASDKLGITMIIAHELAHQVRQPTSCCPIGFLSLPYASQSGFSASLMLASASITLANPVPLSPSYLCQGSDEDGELLVFHPPFTWDILANQ